jgi:Zn-dependent peptidase ImmA (M78 family)
MGMRKTKLTVEQVLKARLRYAAGERELARLASDYGVSRSAIANAVLGYTFKHLPMPPRSR